MIIISVALQNWEKYAKRNIFTTLVSNISTVGI
jgi:hypothetical protein